MGRKKNLPLIEEIEIEDIGSEGKALTKHNGQVIFIQKDALPGDVVDLQVVKKRKRFLEAVPVHFHQYSNKRDAPFCMHFGVCGGCKWQNLQYTEQLYYKQKQVEEQLKHIGKLKPEKINQIIPSPETRYYRNKLEFTFSSKRWLTEREIFENNTITDMNALGLHIPGKFDKVLDLKECFLQPEPSNSIRLAIKEYAEKMELSFFDLRSQQGFLRNLIIRTALTGEVMVILSFFYDEPEDRKALLEHLRSSFPEITSLYYVINSKANDSITDLKIMHYAGEKNITERIGEVNYKIGPVSFFQTNSKQTYHLYEKIIEFAGFHGNEMVYDLYSGIGTITNYIAGKVKKVIGIDNVSEAIAYAKDNAALNNIGNTAFFHGEMRNVLTSRFFNQHGKPDTIILDPPRAGLHEKVVNSIRETMPSKIVYVSCNPSTQARDISMLSDQYSVKEIQPVDMFPHTYHVENIALLQHV